MASEQLTTLDISLARSMTDAELLARAKLLSVVAPGQYALTVLDGRWGIVGMEPVATDPVMDGIIDAMNRGSKQFDESGMPEVGRMLEIAARQLRLMREHVRSIQSKARTSSDLFAETSPDNPDDALMERRHWLVNITGQDPSDDKAEMVTVDRYYSLKDLTFFEAVYRSVRDYIKRLDPKNAQGKRSGYIEHFNIHSRPNEEIRESDL